MGKTIIVWDFSWIQNYLFDIRKNKSATKRLKWRSLFIELLLEKIKEGLKQKLGVENFVDEKWNKWKDYLVSWWKFILICENFNKTKFLEFKKEIEEELFKQFYWELKIIFGCSNWDWDFKNSLNKAYEDVEKNKLRAFESILINSESSSKWQKWDSVWQELVLDCWERINLEWQGKWNEDIFVFIDDRWPQSVCKFSKDRLIDENMTKVINEKYLWKDKDKLKDFYWTDEETNWNISKEAWNDILITEWIKSWNNLWIEILDVKEIEEILEKFNRNKLKLWLPFNEKEKQLKTFEELADWGNFNKLAVLKWDIDGLWEIFQFGLKEENYQENYKKLSEILDKFWKEELYEFISNDEKYKNKIYVVYAGGDDFTIIWRWDVIIEFYKDLLSLFKKYLKDSWVDEILDWKTSEDIHFSGAINLFWAHDTFFTIVKQAESLLEGIKDWDKNQISIFWKVLENKDFVKIFEEAKKFEERFVETDVVSSWTLRFLLGVAKKKILEEDKDWKDKGLNEKNFFEYWTWRAELFYHLARNYKTKNWDSEKDEFRKYIDWMLLKNEVKEFKSLSWNDLGFKWESPNKKVWEKLFVMMSLLLYWKRDRE